MLRPVDTAELGRRGHTYTQCGGNGETFVILTNFHLPEGLSPRQADLLLRVPSLFPAVHPDMFWVSPALCRTDGRTIPATQVTENLVGRSWQRWSRHLRPDQWRPDRDDLGTYLDIVGQCLRAAVT